MAYNTANVHRLRSFAEAKAWFEKVKPIRGNEEEVRPYGLRRHWHMASISMPDADTVVLSYYMNPLVIWKSDDSFTVQAPVYYSAYAADHLHWYLPFERGFFEWNKGRMFISQNDGRKYPLSRSTGLLEFQKIEGKFFMLNKPLAYNVRKDRKAYKTALAKYTPFLDWAGVVLSINNKQSNKETLDAANDLTAEAGLPTLADLRHVMNSSNWSTLPVELRADIQHCFYNHDRVPFRGRSNYGSYSGFNRPTCEVLNNWVTSDNPDLWVKALYAVGAKQNIVFSWQGADAMFVLPHEQVSRYIETLCCYMHRDTVFKKVLLDDGVVASKTNGQYFEPEVTIVSKGLIDSLSTFPTQPVN